MAICISEKPSGHRAFRKAVFVAASVPVRVDVSVPVCMHARLHGRFRAGLRDWLHTLPLWQGNFTGSHKGHEVGKAITDSIAAR